MKQGFPLLTTKKMAWKTMVTELLWFLRGDTNIKYLVDNNCHIRDGDPCQRYKTTNPDYVRRCDANVWNFVINLQKHIGSLHKMNAINKIKTDDEFITSGVN